MVLTDKLKQHILDAISADYGRKKSKDQQHTKVRHANSLGINPSIYSRMANGETNKVLSDGEWLRIGLELQVDMNGLNWQTADTATTSLITTQLHYCKQHKISAIFCDDKGIGKSYTAKQFRLQEANVCYVDCSLNHTKRGLIRAIAKGFGFDYQGKLGEVKASLVTNIFTLDNPLIILDEAGDLSYEAWLEVKSLWNHLEGMCGFYMMGANGLKVKIDRHIQNYKVGYEEIFDRFGDRYQQITKELTEAEKTAFKRHQAEMILRANLPKISKQTEKELLNACNLNLRRLQIEIIKHKNIAA